MEEKPSKETPVDRDIPSVAVATQRHNLIMGLFFILVVAALVVIVVSGSKQDPAQHLVTHEDVAFKTSGNTSAPYIRAEAAEEKSGMDGPDPLALQREQMMQQEALRRAQEQQKKLQQRLHSPQVIYDQPAGAARNTPDTPASEGSILAGNDMSDSNIAFAAQTTERGVETSRATQLRNLDTLIAQGTMIGGILETAIQSDLPGMIRAVVSEDIYSFDGSTLLIPKGARLVGQYKSGLVRGQSRGFVIWNRLLKSDGVTVNLDSFGTDALGRAGLDGKIDTHFFERFGSSVLLSMIDTSLQIVANNSRNSTSATVALETGDDFSRAAEIALENSIAIPPTINIKQGKRIKVFVSKDLDFSQVMGKQADTGTL